MIKIFFYSFLFLFLSPCSEPGYYEAGNFGIRIENLMIVVDKPALGEFVGRGKRERERERERDSVYVCVYVGGRDR